MVIINTYLTNLRVICYQQEDQERQECNRSVTVLLRKGIDISYPKNLYMAMILNGEIQMHYF